MTKKPYHKPVITKVRLDLKTSVLSVCQLSLGVDPSKLACKNYICFTP